MEASGTSSLAESKGKRFDTARAYCTAADSFIQPMRADICNRRYDLEPEEDCEYYEAAASGSVDGDGDGNSGGGGDGDGDATADQEESGNGDSNDR
mgnify:CR=1 FL=1